MSLLENSSSRNTHIGKKQNTCRLVTLKAKIHIYVHIYGSQAARRNVDEEMCTRISEISDV